MGNLQVLKEQVESVALGAIKRERKGRLDDLAKPSPKGNPPRLIVFPHSQVDEEVEKYEKGEEVKEDKKGTEKMGLIPLVALVVSEQGERVLAQKKHTDAPQLLLYFVSQGNWENNWKNDNTGIIITTTSKCNIIVPLTNNNKEMSKKIVVKKCWVVYTTNSKLSAALSFPLYKPKESESESRWIPYEQAHCQLFQFFPGLIPVKDFRNYMRIYRLGKYMWMKSYITGLWVLYFVYQNFDEGDAEI